MWLHQAFVPAQQACGPPAALSLDQEGWPVGPHCPRGAAGASVEMAPAALIHLLQVTSYLHLLWLDSGEGMSLRYWDASRRVSSPPTRIGKSRLLQQETPPLCSELPTTTLNLGQCWVQLTHSACSQAWAASQGRDHGRRVGYCDCSETILSPAHIFLMLWTTVVSEHSPLVKL